MRKLSLLIAGLLMVAGTGCAPARPAATDAQWKVAIRPTPYATVADARILREGNELVVSGTVRRAHEIHLGGHVDLTILGAEGQPLTRHVITVPGLMSKRGDVQSIPFLYRLPQPPVGGTAAVLRYHAGADPG